MKKRSRWAKLSFSVLILSAILGLSAQAEVSCDVVDNCHYCSFDNGVHGYLIWCKPEN
jgi:hypothetical protein